MILVEDSEEMKKINEMFVSVQNSLDPKLTNSIYYSRLKHAMFKEIVDFCKEKVDLKLDLLTLRTSIGDCISDYEIKEQFDALKAKYNNEIHDVGIEYHIETTRIDYGVCVFCIIKRDKIYAKKFVFRFRKNPQVGIEFADIGPTMNPIASKVVDDVHEILGGGKE